MKYGIDTRCQHLADVIRMKYMGRSVIQSISLQHLQETE